MTYDSQFDLYIKCPMKYGRYPFDKHECYVHISSADLNSTGLVFNMTKNPRWHEYESHDNVGYFDVEIFPLKGAELEDLWQGEVWSLTGLKLRFTRRYWRHIVNYYLPSLLFVIISWVSFLVPHDDVNARVALLVTMLLVLVTVLNGLIDNSPNAREGPTALGIWMFSMIVFIILAFVCHSVFIIKRRRKAATGKGVKNIVPEMKEIVTQVIKMANPTTANSMQFYSVCNINANDGKVKKSNSNLIDVLVFAVLFILLSIYVAVY